MRTGIGCAALLLATAALAVDKPIPYVVTQPDGFSGGELDAKNAYYRKKRGDFDRETMVEVEHKDRPSDLPPPTVVAPSPVPMVKEFKAGKVLSINDLKGEDRIFQTIYDDIEKEKCIWDPESCEPPPPSQQRRQFLPND
ncbi:MULTISPECIES: hypothetical protein [Neptunomonas]|uniref:DUF4124 domain-containing protein n=1 Tax=Neptunomonas marina TaxID=1815562 RepID=A0A437QC60_9GAMM|nr:MULTISPECIES: hypothetical protein [Neptunomonas]RVU32101.1 hypothetical protein EOE65_00135 [Neptunomonas marina]